MKRSFSSGIASFLSAVLFMSSGFGNGMIYALEEETDQQPAEIQEETPAEPAADPEWFLADLCDTQTVAEYYEYPGNANYGVTNGMKIEEKGTTATDGTVFTKRFSAGAPKDAFKTDKSLKVTVSETSHIVVYCQSSGDGARVLEMKNEAGEVVKDFTAVGKAETVAPSAAVTIEAGTYYLFSTNSTVVTYGLHIMKGEAPRRPWSEVPAPVITNVTRGDDGKLTVEYEAEFGNDGADNARIFMFHKGFEVACQETASLKPAVFTPISNGDHTFKVVIMRSGEADKESEEYTYKDYILPPAQPSITWLANLGEGKVYADWNNVEADQGCDVFYKEAAAADDAYVSVETGNQTGNITIEGLTPGTAYTVKVVAKDTTSGDSVYTRDITVGDPVQEWYADCFGSCTEGNITINDVNTAVRSYSALYPVSEHLVEDVTNGNGVIRMDLNDKENGKIADSEEGILVYYTRLNPSTENFKLTATFELTDTQFMGNQAGFGIYAIDIAGLGTKDAKYMNSVAVGNFKLRDGEVTKYHHSGVRVVTGYESYDPTSTSGTGRVLDNTRVFARKPAEDKINPGEKYTYTLEKTNDGFKATYEGETFEIPGVSKLMVQEDGSMIVALAVGRCNGTITDIHFEKTAGSAGEDTEVDEITPEVKIYSSDTTGSASYTFMANANVKGNLTLAADGMNVGSPEVGPELVAKIDTTLAKPGEINTFTYKFVPDPSVPNLTSYDPVEGTWDVKWRVHGVPMEVVYTSPDAPINGQGTREDPVDLQTMLKSAMPGQTIIMLDGTYAPTEQYLIPRNVCGEEGKVITLMPENEGKVKVTGTNMTSPSLFHIVGSWWHVYGIEFCDGKAKGVSVSGNHNTVEMCVMHDVGNSGVQISRYTGEPNVQEMWPSYNLIKNCEAYNCCDPARNDADGFAAKLTCGEGNVFYGCISHHNIDDGWDLYAKSTTGPIGAATIENCIAYSNGFLLGDDPSDPTVAFGEGNGFKLGGENMYGAHKLINSVSFNNYAKGITSNSGPDCQVINCTAYNNSLKGGSYNLSLYTKASNDKAWVVTGTISIATNGTTAAELGSSNGILYSYRSPTNYLFDGKKSLNNQGVEATEDWFENVDVTQVPTRNEDGTINMHGLLVLKDSAPKDSGARISTSADAASVKPSYDPEMIAGSEKADRMVEYEMTDGISEDSLNDDVKAATGAKTAAELESFLKEAALGGFSADDNPESTVTDALVKVSFDGGVTWIKADEETFPTQGVDLVFAYPEGTNAKDYDFVIAHLITKNINNKTAGTLEILTPAEEEDGLHVHADSTSPFAIGYKKVTQDEPEPQPEVKEITMHRLYNPNSGEHFYTANAGEKDALVNLGWQYEGVGWIAPETSNSPVYRLYNQYGGEHHYTLNAGERDALVKAGWTDEKIGWYSDDAKTVTIWREYNPNAQSCNHNYTANKGEHDALIKLGWKDENIGWYALRAK